MIHIKGVVSGKVQGVGFRYYTKVEADKRKIRGTVTNQPDGTVVFEAIGSRVAIEQFTDWLRQGPPASTVESVVFDVVDAASTDDFSTFVILR